MNTTDSIPGNQDNEQSQSNDESNSEQSLPVRNPFNPADDKKITQEDIDNEQKFKEALSERD
jgi:protein tyrosine phosphatase (PTP) superfamily phosphohydrolase (DUF442 family)